MEQQETHEPEESEKWSQENQEPETSQTLSLGSQEVEEAQTLAPETQERGEAQTLAPETQEPEVPEEQCALDPMCLRLLELLDPSGQLSLLNYDQGKSSSKSEAEKQREEKKKLEKQREEEKKPKQKKKPQKQIGLLSAFQGEKEAAQEPDEKRSPGRPSKMQDLRYINSAKLECKEREKKSLKLECKERGKNNASLSLSLQN